MEITEDTMTNLTAEKRPSAEELIARNNASLARGAELIAQCNRMIADIERRCGSQQVLLASMPEAQPATREVGAR